MSHFALANATSTMADYVSISNSWCTGVNTHKFTKASLSSCASACSKAKCACFAYRATSSSAPRDNCKYVTDLDFRGTSKSKAGFTAYERRGIQVRSSSRGSGSGPIAAGAASGGFCRFDDLSLLRPAERTPTTPPFYLFLPSSIDERALSDCVTRRTGAPWNTTRDLASWASASLRQHPARVTSPESAEVIFIVPFAALSTAAGVCNGKTHFDRMLEVASALRTQAWFVSRPRDCLVLNGIESTSKNPLGELGAAVSSKDGKAACLTPKHCGHFSSVDKMLPLPWPSLAALQTAAVRTRVDAEACADGGGNGGATAIRRDIPLFFRGSLGSSREAQDLRVRLPLLRQIVGAQISFVYAENSGGSGHGGGGASEKLLLPAAAQFAAKNHLSVTGRLKRMDGAAYAQRMLSAKFCLAPAGDVGSSAGSRLFDAIAAGCIPILVGVDRSMLPLSRQLDYAKFAGFVSRTAFMKDPVYACETLMHKLESKLPAMRRALADARQRLLYGYGVVISTASSFSSTTSGTSSVGAVFPMLIKEHRMATVGGGVIPELK